MPVPISALPLPPPTHILTRHLTPDPDALTPSDFHQLLQARPSVQRRSRLLAGAAHFSYVTPCPLAFPFQIAPPEDGAPVPDKTAYVERWLAERDALLERPLAPSPRAGTLKKYAAEKKDEPRVLVALAETALQDCLPGLSVGDALRTLGTPALAHAYGDDVQPEAASVEDVVARQELVDVLSGQAVLMNVDGDPEHAWAPWSLRYSGHQFGVWAGQLGDGRAISILTTPKPDDPEEIYELQLKGAGRTPFSRFADGLAVLRSSIREFLCSEAINALGIPTTRALALVALPALPVHRERTEPACILTRLAPSFVRIGSFEALSPPAGIGFFGTAQQDAHWDALRVLGEWVARRMLRLEGVRWREDGQEGGEAKEGDAWGRELVLEVARRNMRMVAGWQAYGFMHGVINTDNVSILGLTIDYGPYSFMDVFDSFHICNHDDGEGRYSYRSQPNAVLFALRALLNTLAPLIGAEAELGRAVPPGWADGVASEKLDAWRKAGTELVMDELEHTAVEACAAEYGRLMHKRLGLRRMDGDDESRLARPLLDLMEQHKLDFHGTFRRLAFFRPSFVTPPPSPPSSESSDASSAELDAFIAGVLALCGEPQFLERDKARADWLDWLRRYAARIESERGEWAEESGDVDRARREAMKKANPRFVLRQWLLEEVIKNVERDIDSGKRLLGKVLQMACNPFDPWGAEGFDGDESTLDAEVREERRYCSMGDRKFLGFQCSCSS